MYSILSISLLTGFFVGTAHFAYELYTQEYIQNTTWRLAGICLQECLTYDTCFYFCAGIIIFAFVKLCSFLFRRTFLPLQCFLAFFPLTAYCWWLKTYYTIFTFSIPHIFRVFFFEELTVDEFLFLLSSLIPVFIIILCCLCAIPVSLWIVSKTNFFSSPFNQKKWLTGIMAFLICINTSGMIISKLTFRQCPNVVLIVIDTLRADHLPLYGYTHNTAPFLTELSAESTVCDNSYSTSSWTSPSTASIFTSLYPFQHGLTKGIFATLPFLKKYPYITINTIPKKLTTLPELFRNNGYSTFGISDNLHICKTEGFHHGFDRLYTTYHYQGAQSVNKTVLRWASTIKKRSPYFLYIHYMDPHKPYNERQPWFKKQHTTFNNLIAAYDSEISYVDEHIKQLFSHFDWKNNTIVMITSDHGESFKEHGNRVGHGSSLFNEEIRVPLIIYAPAIAKTGRITENVSGIDVLPTLAAMSGITDVSFREGLNILSPAQAPLAQRYIYGHLFNRQEMKDIDEEQFSLYTIIHKHWKYILSYYYTKLFNLRNDPAEKSNLFTLHTTPAKQLAAQLEQFKATCKRYGHSQTTIHINKLQIKELKSLGYVQ